MSRILFSSFESSGAVQYLKAVINIVSNVVARARVSHPLKAVISAISNVTATAFRKRLIKAVINAISIVSAKVKVNRALKAVINVVTFVTALLRKKPKRRFIVNLYSNIQKTYNGRTRISNIHTSSIPLQKQRTRIGKVINRKQKVNKVIE